MSARVRPSPDGLPAWAAVYDRCAAVAYGSALAILGDSGSAEAVVEEAFVEVARSPGTIGTIEAVGDLVEAATHRLAVEARTARDGRPSADLFGHPTPAARAAFEMAVYEGLSARAIAERMQTNERVIGSLLGDALRALRAEESGPSSLSQA